MCGDPAKCLIRGLFFELVGETIAKLINCNAHARRKFDQAKSSDGQRATEALHWIQKLYKVEKHANDLNAMARYQRRQRESKPLLEALKLWLEAQRQEVLPKSPMGQAIGYALNQWQALNRYLENGELQIDNNIAERAMRRVVIVRKNWLFAGSDRGGRTAAILYSVMETCRRLEINPHRYLRDLFLRLTGTSPAKLQELLPNQWIDPIKQAIIMPPVELFKQIKV